MAIRVDPRRLGLLKELAAAEGLRPGQLVQRWVEERLDAERSGVPVPAGAGAVAADRVQALEADLAALASRVDHLVARISAAPEPASPTAAQTEAAQPRRRGRPRTRPLAQTKASANGKVALHDEIIAVLRDSGPSTAAELATAIRERGRYQPPRSAKPLDAATVNSRVSNRVYRARFRRSGGKISLAE
ncbi:MAG TPA: hypothetical protein VKU35_01555 [Candidatus Limnocylindria bacterium]|nr:hypothetical protein [Candidatus Limnocylindria bacterium]